MINKVMQALAFFLACLFVCGHSMPEDLRVDYLVAPTIDNPEPRFSWRTPSVGPARAQMQAGYRLTVTESGSSNNMLFDSGPIQSNQSTFVTAALAGKLKSNTRYQWTVSVDGSAPVGSSFATGLMSAADWEGADWVESSNSSQQASQMRTDFQVSSVVTRASLYVCVPGYGTVSFNGARVDGGAGIRSWSQYDVRALYSTYDVTNLVQMGNNTIGIYTGRGWYSHFGYGAPTVRAVLQLTMANGKTQRVVTDATWTENAGPVNGDDEYNGETYDARLETPGWNAPGFATDTQQWLPVKVTTKTNKLQHTVLAAAAFPAIEKIHTFVAHTITEPSPGVWVIDFEQNLSGWIRIHITGAAGTRIQLRHAEALQHPPYGPYDGNIYVGNLRGAKATDVYILKGDPAGETFEPVFTQHGFRYVEVTGVTAPPSLETIEAVHVRSAVETTGSVSFSDPLLNQVQHNLYWGQSTNLMMIPTDCDQRDERLGWTGDSALTAEEAVHNFDMGAFYENWAQMLDETSPNGAIGCTVPGRAGAGDLAASKSCDASWTSAYPSVLHAVLKYYGDLQTPQKHWSSLTRFLDNEYSRIVTGGVTAMFANFGDWVPPPPAKRVTIQYTSTFSFLNDLRNVIFMADKLGHKDDAVKYQAIFANVSSMWHEHWWSNTTGLYADGGQTAQVLALQLDVMPKDVKQAVVDGLVADIIAHGNHTTCGIIGWRFECEVLSANGHADLAYALMTQTTYPSYGFEIKHPYEPATTIWELWDGPTEGPHMNSRDHIMFGGPGAWLYQYVGGISQASDSIGFEHAVLAPPAQLIAQALAFPKPDPNSTTSAPLRFASVEKSVPKGLFSMSWQIRPDGTATCVASAAENAPFTLQCPGSSIASVVFASYGTPTGGCDTALNKSTCSADLTQYVTQQCVGHESCVLSCGNGKCGVKADPCEGTLKHVAVQVTCSAAPPTTVLAVTSVVPHNAVADTVLPTLSAAHVDIHEGGTPIWSDGKYLPGAAGITGATAVGESVQVAHGSGTYSFEVSLS